MARVVAYTFTAAWPLVLDSGFVPDGETWVPFVGFALFLILLGVSAALFRHRGADAHADAVARLARVEAGLAEANAVLAGALEGLAVKLDTAIEPRRRTLTHDECRAVCVGLLARIRALADTALGPDVEGIRLRVTLAVPLREDEAADGGRIAALRVWCYDQTYDDRRFTRMALDGDGAPEAFRNGAVAIVPDIHDLPIPDATARRFRSVVCYPVRAGAGKIEALGVVNIDADRADFFTPERNARLNTYIQPAVQALGIPLASRRNGPLSFTP